MKKDIKISEVLTCLEEGMSRVEIATYFEITMVDCKRLFKHPLLKGKKAKKQVEFNLIDDVSDGVIDQILNSKETYSEEFSSEELDKISSELDKEVEESVSENETHSWEN